MELDEANNHQLALGKQGPSGTAVLTRSGGAAGYAPAVAVLLAGIVVSLASFFIVRERDREQARLSYERTSLQIAAALQGGFDRPLEVLYSIPSLFEASEDVNRHEFAAFVSGALKRHPSIYALEWIPVVPATQRDAVEQLARDEGLNGFELTEVGPDGRMIRAAGRPEHLPILFMEPPNRTALGFDIAAEEFRRAPADRARDRGAAVSSPRIRLVEDDESISSVAVFFPVYHSGLPAVTLEQRRANVQGYATVVFRIQPVVQLALADIELEGLRVVLLDEPVSEGRQLLYESGTADGERKAVAGGYQAERPFSFADREWTLRVATTAPTLDQAAAYRSLPLLLGGFGLSGLLALLTAGAAVVFRLRKQVEAAQQLGQYTLIEKIGEGGMGVVYKARHAMLRRQTAIKLLPPTGEGQVRIARFEREVQLTSRLTHPNTIAVFDYGRTPEGIFYYAMEYLDGITFEELVREDGPQRPGRVVHLLEQVCGALSEAHGVGLIHRDIKPGNLMVCSRGGIPDFVKVLDFGLVKETGARHEVTLSAAGQVVGTPYYLPPEAITAPEQVDGRSDIYALGAVAFFMLTGRRVFEGHTTIEVLGQHLHAQPPAPSEVLGHETRTKLDDVVLRCLEKNAVNRPSSAQELRTLLQQCGASPWTEQDARQWWSSRGERTVASIRLARALGEDATVERAAKTTVEVDLRRRGRS